MKILIVMDPGISIPVKGYGGIERIIEMLAIEYTKKGHAVDLLITSGSFVEGCTVYGIGKEGFPPKKSDARKAIPTIWKFLKKHKNEYDLIHNFGRLIYLLPVLNSSVSKIMSYQREITKKNSQLITLLACKNLLFTGCSQDLITRARVHGNWEAVHNCCDFSKYQLNEHIDPKSPLVFLGRLEKVKGCHTAIQVAKLTGNSLIIAGNISQLEDEKEYFTNEIQPYIDNDQIRYIGSVNDKEKNELLRSAQALLFPIEWNEPFGIVMIEAMACGTPVIAFNKGSVTEVIDEGTTGFKVKTKLEMMDAVKNIHTIVRKECRRQAEARFNVSKIVNQYLDISNVKRKRVVILSTHQPAANPRALKEYETFKNLNYSVKHLYAYNAEWSYKIDENKFKEGKLQRQDFIEIGGNPNTKPIRFLIARILHKIFRLTSVILPFSRDMSMEREAFSFWLLVRKYPANMYISHYLGTLPGAFRAAMHHQAKIIFDAEDFHRGEEVYYVNQKKNVIYIEDKYLSRIDAITAASPLISEAYKKLYPGRKVETINNVFPVSHIVDFHVHSLPELKLFWFSQNITKYRGLEIFVQALNYLKEKAITLTILGHTGSDEYKKFLLSISECPEKIIFKIPVPPESLFAVTSKYDIGLAGEIPDNLNKEICLSNKIFTYLLAGNCILASDVRGQKEFMEQYPGIGSTYKFDDPKDLADKIEKFYNDRALLEQCRKNAFTLAKNKLNWELEEKKWLAVVRSLLPESLAS